MLRKTHYSKRYWDAEHYLNRKERHAGGWVGKSKMRNSDPGGTGLRRSTSVLASSCTQAGGRKVPKGEVHPGRM